MYVFFYYSQLRVSELVLSECFKSVDLSSCEIVLISDVRIPHHFDLERLSLEQPGTELGQDEIADVFQFIQECRTLQQIRYYFSQTCLTCAEVLFRVCRR